MKKLSGQALNCTAALLMGCVLAVPTVVGAQDHVVPPAAIQNDVTAASTTRQQNEKQLRSFLATKDAQEAMRQAKIDPKQVNSAVSQLSDDEMAKLAAQSQKAQAEYAAGSLDHPFFVLAVLAIILIILLVVFA